jgi:hypothetical protein
MLPRFNLHTEVEPLCVSVREHVVAQGAVVFILCDTNGAL